MSARRVRARHPGTRGSRKERGAHALQVVDGDFVPEEVEEDILERAGVSVGEDKPVPVDPLRVRGVAVKQASWGEMQSRAGQVDPRELRGE